MRWFTLLLLLILVGCGDLATLFKDSHNDFEDAVSVCHVELVLDHGSHSTLLVYASPFDRLVTDAIGGLYGSCRSTDCQRSLPVIGQLGGSDAWYQVIYQEQNAWVSIHLHARLVGNCGTIPTVILAEPG